MAMANRWIQTDFLRVRELSAPDGRPLYAYRCKVDEYEQLRLILSNCVGETTGAIRAFVLYASEWWQRSSTGQSAWEPLLQSIGWQRVHYPELYEPVKAAWKWWKVDLVRLPTSTRYLGTFACQGGLPLALIGDSTSPIARYLRGLLKHYVAYGRFVHDPIDLAREKQHLLKPPTLRRDYVLRLAVELVEAVVDLREEVADVADPIAALDERQPGWRSRMPLDLGSARALGLLESLFREVSSQSIQAGDDFSVERYLRQTDSGWRLCAEVRTPASIPATVLASRLGVGAQDLPPRLEVRVTGNRTESVGRYAARGDEFVQVAGRDRSTLILDHDAAQEVHLEFVAGNRLGEPVTPRRGAELSELPWIFGGGSAHDDWRLIGEGSGGSRYPTLRLLLATGTDVVDADVGAVANLTEVLGRRLIEITAPVAFATSAGRCRVRPSSENEREDDYRFVGRRCYAFDCVHPLFYGRPNLRLSKGEQALSTVPQGEMSWRRVGGGWGLANPIGSGLWECRHVADGEVRFFGRAYLVPEKFRIHAKSGATHREGYLTLDPAKGLRVASQDPVYSIEADAAGDSVVLHVFAADNDDRLPARVRATLSWDGADECMAALPFPGRGARFVSGGGDTPGTASVSALYGIRAVAFSGDARDGYRLEGELRANDVGNLRRVTHITRHLRSSGIQAELPLVELRGSMEALLAGSHSIDAYVRLSLVDAQGLEQDSLDIRRFANTLQYEPEIGLIRMDPPVVQEGTVRYETVLFDDPGGFAHSLPPLGLGDGREGATVPIDVDLSQQQLVVARDSRGVVARPCVIGSRDGSELTPESIQTFAEASQIADLGLRTESMGVVFDTLGDADAGDPNWAFLADTLAAAEDLPFTTFSLLDCLVNRPNIVVRSLFQLESAYRDVLWRLEDELLFSWTLVRRSHWRREARAAYRRLLQELGDVPGAENLASGQILSVLNEGADRNGALAAVQADVEFMLAGESLSEAFLVALQSSCEQALRVQIALRATFDDWPRGDDRDEWTKELKLPPKFVAVWHEDLGDRRRRALLDTPVAAAWSTMTRDPTRRTTYMVKHIRAHDPEWFDRSFCAAWANFARVQDKVRS